MGYADSTFYSNTYHGAPLSDDILLDRASEIIDMITGGKSTAFDNLGSDVQSLIKYAVCAEAEYLDSMGGICAAQAACSGGSVSIGGFSISGGAAACNSVQALTVARAVMYLERTGLLYRGDL